MKSIRIHPTPGRFRYIGLPFLALVLITATGCTAPAFGSKEKDNAAAIEILESRFHKLESGLSGVVFWQATAAVFFVLSGFALVGGAALGSRARRDRDEFSAGTRPESIHPGRKAA